MMLIHTNSVLLQHQIIFLSCGSSELREADAEYISGIRVPCCCSSLCSRITCKQAIGSIPSVKSENLTSKVCDSDWNPATRGIVLNMVSANWTDGLV